MERIIVNLLGISEIWPDLKKKIVRQTQNYLHRGKEYKGKVSTVFDQQSAEITKRDFRQSQISALSYETMTDLQISV